MLLLGAGPRALLLQLAHPLVAAGVDEHSDFRADPWARLQATLRSYLDDRLRDGDGGTGGDPPPERAPPIDRRRRATPLAIPTCRCGSTRRSSTRRSSPTTPGSSRCPRDAAGALLRGDAADRPGVRGPGRSPAGRPRRVRGLRRLDARRPTGRSGSRATARELAWHVLHPPLGPVLPALAAVPAPVLRLDALAVDRVAAGVGPRPTTASAGARSSAPSPAGSSPRGGSGGRSCRSRSGRCRRCSPPIAASRATLAGQILRFRTIARNHVTVRRLIRSRLSRFGGPLGARVISGGVRLG